MSKPAKRAAYETLPIALVQMNEIGNRKLKLAMTYVARFAGFLIFSNALPTACAVGYGYTVRFANWLTQTTDN